MVEEFLKIAKQNTVNKDIRDKLCIISKANLSTKNKILEDYIVDNSIYHNAINIMGEEIKDMNDEIEQLSEENKEYKKIIGDNKVSEEIRRKCSIKLKCFNSENEREVARNKKLIARLSKRVTSIR